MTKDDLQSRTIDVMRLVLIYCAVVVHSYTATRGDIDSSAYPAYRFISFLLSLNITQIAIPGFFFISGYLYFFKEHSYTHKLGNMWPLLVRPYLLWNALMLVAYASVELIPHLSGYLSGDNLPITQYGLMNFVRAFWDGGSWDGGDGTPILHQFWYVRNLILLGLLSPLLQLFVRRLGLVGVIALLLWWVFTPGLAMTAKSFSFFCAGAWFSLHRDDFLPLFQRYNRSIAILYLLIVTVVMLTWNHPCTIYLNRLGNIVGIAFFFNCTAWLITRRYAAIRSFTFLHGLVFFTYAFHDPMIIFVKRAMLKIVTPASDLSLVVIYFLAPTVVMAICVGVYYLLKRGWPGLLNLLVGERVASHSDSVIVNDKI